MPKLRKTTSVSPSEPNGSNSQNQWMTVSEAAEYLRTTVRGIHALVYRGRIAAYKPFGKLLFKRTELERAVEAARVGGPFGY